MGPSKDTEMGVRKKNYQLASEHAIQNDTLVRLSEIENSVFYRNNTGRGWAGQKLRLTPGQHIEILPGMVVLMNAQPISFGFPGSGDIMGCAGKIPLSVEIKDADGEQEDTQVIFERNWKKAGGVYIVARTPDEAISKVYDAILS